MISKFSIVGMVGGFLFSLLSGIRYFAIYVDEDKGIAYVIIGILIMCVAWLYQSQLNHSNKIGAIEDYLAEKSK